MFNQQLKLYEFKMRAYTTESKSIATLKGWVEATVELNLRQTNCEPHEDLRVWYKNLKEAIGNDDFLAQAKATIDFNNFMQPTGRAPRDLNKWISDFEAMMMESQSMKVPNSLNAINWFTQLEQVTLPFLGHELEIWRTQYITELKNNTLSFREIANQMRFAVMMDATARKNQKGIKRGAFPADTDTPSFDGEEADQREFQLPNRKKQKAKQPQENPRRSGSQGSPSQPPSHPPSQQRQQSRRGGRGSPTCKACGQFHQLTDCWYIFPENAPGWFKPHQAFIDYTKSKMASDKGLALEVERLQRKREETE